MGRPIMFGLTTTKRASAEIAKAYSQGLTDGAGQKLRTERVLLKVSIQLAKIIEEFKETLSKTIEDVTKESTYKGTEVALKHAVEQISALDFKTVLDLWKEEK